MATVIIADDSQVTRNSLRKILSQAGHTVVAEAENGLQAIDAYRRLQPDILTMDINMPMMNGIDAVERIVTDYQQARIVMISGIDERDKVFRALEKGAKHYLIKPFNEKAVVRVVEVVLETGPSELIPEWEES